MQKKSNSGGSLRNNSSKAKKVLIVSLTLGLTMGIGVCVADKYLSPNKKLNDKTIAMYIQNEEGAYTASTENTFPTDGYVLNVEKSNCRNGGTITQDSSTKKISLTASKTDTCTLYFDKVLAPTAEQTLAKLGLTSNGIKESFASVATTDEGIFEMEDDYGTSYYFRGAVENNYVKFGKNKSGQDMYWRIIRINGDGSLRIIYDGTSAHANGETNIDRVAFDSIYYNFYPYDAKAVGYMYNPAGSTNSKDKDEAQTNTESSTIKTAIDNWYKENIVDTGYSGEVSDEIFCNDRSFASNNKGTGYGDSTTTFYGARWRFYSNIEHIADVIPTFKCIQKNDAFTVSDTKKGNGSLTYPVALITIDEAVAAGSLDGKINSKYYLNKGDYSYWTLSPFQFYNRYAHVYHISPLLSSDYVQNKHAGAPVINLGPEYASTLVGTGTMTDPYRAP